MSNLTAERLREVLHYDPDTGAFTWRISNGRRAVAGEAAGGLSDRGPFGYLRIAINKRRYRAHQLAWLYVYGKWPEHHIDHINTNKLDNRIINLRAISPKENPQNQRQAHNHNKVGLLGVSQGREGRYSAEIKVGGKRRYLGRYATPEGAYAAYLKAKWELHPFGTLGEMTTEEERLVKSNKTGFVGVELRPNGRYLAYFNREGKRTRLGPFDSAEEAAEARKKAMTGN